jgi:hypothetical protein
MKLSLNASKCFTGLSILLTIGILFQIWLATFSVPNFIKANQLVINKVVMTYGVEKSDYKSRTIEYRLVPYWLNRYELLAEINFDNGDSIKTQFLISFWPFDMYSIKFIDRLVNADQAKYFDRPEQHVLFDGGDEDFQVLVENDSHYCYVQLSNQAVQCVDINGVQKSADP